ncbi:MAG: MltA domain-containing protein [bacterium]
MYFIKLPSLLSNKLFKKILFILILFIQGCTSLFLSPKKPPIIKVKKLPIANLDNKAQINLAIERQLQVFGKKPLAERLRQFNRQVIPQDRIIKSLVRFQELINNYQGKELYKLISSEFDIYKSTGGDKKGNVLFTGYYTPLFKASSVPDENFLYPLYTLPPNYQRLDVSSLRKDWNRTFITVYVDDKGKICLPPSRQEIEEKRVYAGKGLEIAWLNDPFDVFLAHVQGSLIVDYEDGKRQFLNYAGQNGYEYISVGKELFGDGRMKLEEINITSMRKWFEEHPAYLNEYLNRNNSYIYFTPNNDGPFGAGEAVVTEWASIATDKRLFPVGGIGLIDTEIPVLDDQDNLAGWQKHTCFVIDQDTGGAIVGPGRVDIYMGVGKKAGCLAGYQKRDGDLYYLLLKN